MDSSREMTLEEWVKQLPEFHLANREYYELRYYKLIYDNLNDRNKNAQALLDKLANLQNENDRLTSIIERGNEIRNNRENNEYQEASHYNWLDDQNEKLEKRVQELEEKLYNITGHYDH